MRGGRPPSSFDPPGIGGPSAIVPIIIANVVVFLLQILANGELSSLFGISFATSWQAWRVVTHVFTHDNFWMLLLNMWIFWTLGRPLERRLGVRKLLIIYAIGGLTGMVCWMVVSHGDSMLVGAEGAVGGVVVAAAGARSGERGASEAGTPRPLLADHPGRDREEGPSNISLLGEGLSVLRYASGRNSVVAYAAIAQHTGVPPP